MIIINKHWSNGYKYFDSNEPLLNEDIYHYYQKYKFGSISI
jgi:hypothetical protein